MKLPRWPWLLLGGALLAIGIYRLHFNVEVLDLLPTDEPVVTGLKLYQHHFSNSRELIVTVKGSDAEHTEQAATALASALRSRPDLIASVMWQPAWMQTPREAAELIAYLWFNQPPAVFGELTNRLTGPGVAALLQDARDQLATSMSPLDLARRGYDPFNLLQPPESGPGAMSAGFGDGQNLFASADGTFRMLFVRAKMPLGNYRACRFWLGQVDRILQDTRRQLPSAGNITLAYTGAPAFVTEIAGAMEFDTTLSVGLTSVIIGLLFWLAHRRWQPVLWLLILLTLILGSTLALGGLVFGAINVVSLGFAAILLGLAVDYAVVHYQEAISAPEASIPEIRRAIGPSIFWAAATTISAFLVLNLGGLPGLAQLGTLVALGVGVSALVMIYAFLPPLFRHRMRQPPGKPIGAGRLWIPVEAAITHHVEPAAARKTLVITLLIVLSAAGILTTGLPGLDHTADALRSRHSAAHDALEEIKARLTQGRDPLWIITRGSSEDEIGKRLDRAMGILNQSTSNGTLSGFTLPNVIWPRPTDQDANRSTATLLVSTRSNLLATALAQGFTSNALMLTDTILDTWRNASQKSGVFWPTNEMSRWIFEKVVARAGNDVLAAGLLYRNPKQPVSSPGLRALTGQLADAGFVLSGWELLGPAILKRVQVRLGFMVVPMVLLVGLSLWLAFGRPAEILLSLAVLSLSGVCLLAIMRLCGWSWNLMNLVAVPLMLGTGVDYSIFTLLALRRHGGNRDAAYRSVGRALLLCGGTAVTGFGSLALSSNAGMSSLGIICAVGIAFNMLIAVYLLPTWWQVATRYRLPRPTVG